MEDILLALNPADAYAGLLNFLETGGQVLVVIMGATFFLWALIIERYWYFWGAHGSVAKSAIREWEGRSDHSSWNAHQVRKQLISEVKLSAQNNLNLIKVMVAIAPLLGLLGTVTGMVEVFDVMAFSGSSNARGMAAGVSKATIPTMAGMVASLSGLFFSASLERRAKRAISKVADSMELQ